MLLEGKVIVLHVRVGVGPNAEYSCRQGSQQFRSDKQSCGGRVWQRSTVFIVEGTDD